MTNFQSFMIHFWLFCGLYTGLGGALYLRIKLKRNVAAGQLDRSSLQSFTRGWCIAILTPCTLLWLLALSSGPTASPDYLTWGVPQKWIALGLNIACWLVLLTWVWFGSGAELLSRYLAPAFSSSMLKSPLAVRVLAGLLVAAGICALSLGLGAPQQ